MLPQFNSGAVVQIDVKDYAKRVVQICLSLKRFGRIEKYGSETMFPEQTLNAPEHARIIVHNENCFSGCQD